MYKSLNKKMNIKKWMGRENKRGKSELITSHATLREIITHILGAIHVLVDKLLKCANTYN